MPRAKQAIATTGDFEQVQPAASATAHQEAPELKDTSDFHESDLDIVSGDEQRMKRKVAEAKFFEEKVEIEIEMDDSPDAPIFVMLGHNGITQYVKRGEPQVVKRKFLYSALAAKTVAMACAFGKDASGNEFNRLTPSVRTTHRVRLLRDNNPQGGMKWLRQVAATA